MTTIDGVILIKETSVGVPYLQVVAYGIDRNKYGSNLLTRCQGLDRNKHGSNFLTQWQEPVQPGRQGAALGNRLSDGRLGSVLTDGAGRFSLSFEDRDRKRRAGLVLVVLAPEDSEACEAGAPIPRPWTDRVLHLSYEPIVAPGTHESYVIRLAQARLDALQIPYSADPERAPTGIDGMVAQMEIATEERAGIEEARIAQMRALSAPAVEMKRRIQSSFQRFSLSKLPPSVRALPTYLGPDDDLAVNQRTVAETALSSIPEALADAGIQPRLRIALPRERVTEMGLEIGSDGTVEGEVQSRALFAQIAGSSGGGSLMFKGSPLKRSMAELEAERHFHETLTRCGAVSDAPETAATPSPPGADFDTADALVREHVARQIRHATGPESELSYGVERDGDITATITRPGPADVTSYHDFHDLQIALDFIWKEVFDGMIVRGAQELYAEVVRFTNEVSGVPEEVIDRINEPIESVDDMRRLYEDVRLLQKIISNQDASEDPAEPSAVVVRTPVPEPVKRMPLAVSVDDWSAMEPGEQRQLLDLAADTASARRDKDRAIAWAAPTLLTSLAAIPDLDARIRHNIDAAKALLQTVRGRAAAAANESTQPPATRQPSSRLEELMDDLDRRLSGRFKFDIFAPSSVNYGIMLTYRQAWTPRDYQVGDLVSTVPLAPKEVRKYTKKRVVKKSRTQKELEDAQSTQRRESDSTARVESEIVKRATNRTSFQQTAEGTVNVGVFQGRFGTQFNVDAEKASSSTKRNFREAVVKAAEEYKQQHRLEVETALSEEVETTESGEISNPNDEITVTYLFYELQRQYEVRERIHRLQPVILVANDVPDPDISLDWIIAHHWILRRVILDDHYLPALDYVVASATGDEMALEVMWTNLQRQARLVDDAAEQARRKTELAQSAFDELKRLTQLVQDPRQMGNFRDVNLAAAFGPFALIGLLGGDDDATEKREEVAKLAIERADKDEQEASARLSREVAALQKSIDTYTQALREHLDRQTAITSLRIHIKENILCYMHAIWDYECADQRYFRLYNVEVPWVEVEDETIRVSGTWGGGLMGGPDNPIRLEGEITLTKARIVPRKLAEVADLDNLLGYKGNYSIFPVKEVHHLHWYMMQDYIDPETGGLRDPDDVGNTTTEELLDYACCLKRHDIPEDDPRYAEVLDHLRVRAALPYKESELIIVPTDSLFIEALPGKHPILEDFKLVHRAIDVKKVQAEVRFAELENVRLGARLLASERTDPNIDKQILVEGADDVVVAPEA